VGLTFETMPRVDRGAFLVTTASSTERILWERLPAPDAGAAAYDGRPVTLTLLTDVTVGQRASIIVGDSSYLYGNTTHETAEITCIELEADRCPKCWEPQSKLFGLFPVCPMCKVEPQWYERKDWWQKPSGSIRRATCWWFQQRADRRIMRAVRKERESTPTRAA
jgi:hypothetical protein